MKYIDTHVHYDLNIFNKNRENLLSSLHENGLEWAVCAAIDAKSNETMPEKLGAFPWIYYSAGLHPDRVEVDSVNDELWDANIEKALHENKKIVAIGEAGLDYHRFDREEKSDLEIRLLKARQEKWFRKSIKLANENQLPLIIHIREAHEDGILILSDETFSLQYPGVVHCFYGSYELAKKYMDMGFFLGIGGKITNPDHAEFREAMKKIPLSKIVLETDAPFVKPVGYEAESNNSSTIPAFIATEIAKLKNVSVEEVIQFSNKNAKEMFRMDG